MECLVPDLKRTFKVAVSIIRMVNQLMDKHDDDINNLYTSISWLYLFSALFDEFEWYKNLFLPTIYFFKKNYYQPKRVA
jgi:hypothetical protein